MAFNNVRKEMSRALDHSTNNKEANQVNQVNLSKIKSKVDNTTEIKSKHLNQQKMQFEKTKAYPFTLQPSVRKKIDKLALEAGAKSASSYLNEYFKRL